MSDLKPCPFCNDPDAASVERKEPTYYVVMCLACEAEGPAHREQAEAITSWNQRTTEPKEDMELVGYVGLGTIERLRNGEAVSTGIHPKPWRSQHEPAAVIVETALYTRPTQVERDE